MGDIFKALSGGLPRFIFSWVLPSAITLGVFVLIVLPNATNLQTGLGRYATHSSNGWLEIALFALATLTLSVLFAYCSLPLYRVLEGYLLPRPIARYLLRRQLREWYRLQRIVSSPLRSRNWQLAQEKLQNYPDTRDLILPTRLGNALRSLETYGKTRYGLDSQTLWYELQSTTTATLRRDLEDGRASVDFFVSGIAHLCTLAVACFLMGATTGSVVAWVVGIFALLLTVPAYQSAVRNVADWRYTVRAVVNTGRAVLAEAMCLRMPSTFAEETAMWRATTNFVVRGPRDEYLRFLNRYRFVKEPQPSVEARGAGSEAEPTEG
jgi:hypothetical protein